MSCTCDFVQRDHVLIAPADDLTTYEKLYSGNPEIKEKLNELRSNRKFEIFHVPSFTKTPELFFDLTRINTYEVDFVKDNIQNKKISRVASLSSIGYYFFLMKITAFLLREEDSNEIIRESHSK